MEGNGDEKTYIANFILYSAVGGVGLSDLALLSSTFLAKWSVKQP